jgi:hypothetical protein
MFAIKTTAGLYTEYVHSVRTFEDITMPPRKKSTTEKANEDINKSSEFKSNFVSERLKGQDKLTFLELFSDISKSSLRRVHNRCLDREAESRLKLLERSSIDLGEF